MTTHKHTPSSFPQLLAQVSYFQTLHPETLEQLAQQVTLHHYEKGQVLFLEGEPVVALYGVVSGWVKSVKMSLEGREQVLQFIGPGDPFNMVGVLAQHTNPATTIAIEAATVWRIPKQPILALLESNPAFSRRVIQHLAMRVQQLIQQVEDCSLRTIEARLARYLLDYSDGDQLERPSWATQAEMANRLGTVPDVVNRVLGNLVQQGLIVVERRRIVILNRQSLTEKAQLTR